MSSIISDKSYQFAIRIVKAYQYLKDKKKEYTLAKQLLRSGTAIGALVRESEHAQSRPDFLSKLNISLKEANETAYWLMLLRDTNYITVKQYDSLSVDCIELIKILAKIVKTTKTSLNR